MPTKINDVTVDAAVLSRVTSSAPVPLLDSKTA